MERNEKGQFAASEVNYEKEIAEAEAKVAELKKAQAAKVEAEKKAASEAKKAEANKVEEAFKQLNAYKKSYNAILGKARREYLDGINDLKNKYMVVEEEQNKGLKLAQKVYDEALAEFQKAHPEGFHMTLRDGDNVQTISSYSNMGGFDFDDFFNYFFKRF